MNHYEEGINAMWEDVEGKKPEPVHIPSDEERWKEFVEEYSHSGYLVQSEFGAIDTSEDAMKDVAGGENLSYENICRHSLIPETSEGIVLSIAIIVMLGVISKVKLNNLIRKKER